MEEGTTMEIISKDDPVDLHHIFIQKFEGKHSWVYKKKESGAYIIYIIKNANSGSGDEGFSEVNEFDGRLYPPAEWHEMFQKTYAYIKPGEAFEFINDLDPKPLYYQMESNAESLSAGNISRRAQKNGCSF